ncbi:hypothetical protein Lwal_1887 [Legionella waltersii]|uniref:Uncharacterized protein n=1 Tax=Legionella waltersii TaxID=66969 RepID=A0A0W1AB01_9GAMM|nr:hypothetical protein Lwal_1887 [Legionella waltersii]
MFDLADDLLPYGLSSVEFMQKIRTVTVRAEKSTPIIVHQLISSLMVSNRRSGASPNGAALKQHHS